MSKNSFFDDAICLPSDHELEGFISEHISYCLSSGTDSNEINEIVVAIRELIRSYVNKNNQENQVKIRG